MSLRDDVHKKVSEIGARLGLPHTETIEKLINAFEQPGAPSGGDIPQFEDMMNEIRQYKDTMKHMLEHFEDVIQHDVVGTFDHLRDCQPCIDKVRSAGFKIAYDPKLDGRNAP